MTRGISEMFKLQTYREIWVNHMGVNDIFPFIITHLPFYLFMLNLTEICQRQMVFLKSFKPRDLS